MKIQLKLTERALDFYTENTSKVKELKIKKLKQKLHIYNEEESLLKKSLNEVKGELEISFPTEVVELATQIGKEYFEDLKEKFNIDSSKLLVEKPQVEEKIVLSETSESDDDDYLGDDTKFYDAYESPDKLNEEENKAKMEKVNKINAIKKKILNIGSKKSSLRLALVKLTLYIGLYKTKYLFFRKSSRKLMCYLQLKRHLKNLQLKLLQYDFR